jgi:ferric-dicitrate binding protein FerR (iron transport regulator)
MQDNRLAYLFERYLNGTSTNAENIELSTYILTPEHAETIERLKEEYWGKTEGEIMSDDEVEKHLSKILQPSQTKFRFISLKKVAVAASVIFSLGLSAYFAFFKNEKKKGEIVNVPALKDVEAPKGTKAMITLADGRQVSIDSLTTITQGNVQVTKTTDGKVVYSGKTSEVVYNTLTNPRGSRVIDITLADGSHVWLNAGSSITYPVAFTSNERKVSMTGEAYFEVSHNSSMPFVVSKADVQVQVLGTHFNVNAYDDESDIKVTLLEGSVKVLKGNSSNVIKPGQQARIASDINIINVVDLEQVMAWKNGNFKFSHTDLKVIMREIGRWYDVEVIYEGNIPVQLYNVGVPRTANVSEVLKGLEYTGAHFSVEGKKIIVRP